MSNIPESDEADLYRQRVQELEAMLESKAINLANSVPNPHLAVELPCTKPILARVSPIDDQCDLFYLDFLDTTTKARLEEPSELEVFKERSGERYATCPVAPGVYNCESSYLYRVFDKESGREVAVIWAKATYTFSRMKDVRFWECNCYTYATLAS